MPFCAAVYRVCGAQPTVGGEAAGESVSPASAGLQRMSLHNGILVMGSVRRRTAVRRMISHSVCCLQQVLLPFALYKHHGDCRSSQLRAIDAPLCPRRRACLCSPSSLRPQDWQPRCTPTARPKDDSYTRQCARRATSLRAPEVRPPPVHLTPKLTHATQVHGMGARVRQRLLCQDLWPDHGRLQRRRVRSRAARQAQRLEQRPCAITHQQRGASRAATFRAFH